MADDIIGRLTFKVDVDSKEAQKSVDEFSESVQDATEQTEAADSKVSSSFSNISVKAAAMAVAVGAAFLKVGKEIASAVADIEGGRKTIAYSTGATGEDLENLMDSAKRVFSVSDHTFDEVSRAIGEINTRLGLTGDELENTTALFLDFSEATGQDVQEAVVQTTQAMNRWGLEIDDLPALLDKLTVAGEASGISVSTLTSTLTDNAGTFQSLGYTIDEATAFLATLETQGISSSEVIMAMKKSFAESAEAGTDARTDWEALLESITNATTETEANAIAIDVFGQRIAGNMVQALRSGALETDEFTTALENSAGALASISDAGQTTADNIEILKNNITLLENSLGEVFAPTVNVVVTALSGLLQGFNDLDNSTQTLIISLGLLATAFAIGGPIGIAVGALGAFLLITQDNESAVKDLDKAMGNLTGQMDRYKSISDQLSGSVDSLTDSERALLEVQLRKAEIEIAETLRDVAGSYKEVTEEANEATRAVDIQQGRMEALDNLLVAMSQGSLQNVRTELEALKEKADEGVLSAFEESIVQTYTDYLPDLESALQSGGKAIDSWMEVLAETIEEVYVDYVDSSEEAEKANVALEGSLAVLANAVENGILDVEKYRKLYPDLVADIERYINKNDDAVQTTEDSREASENASTAVEKYADNVDEASEDIADSLDDVTDSVDDLTESTEGLTASQQDAISQMGSLSAVLSAINPMLDSFIEKTKASIDPMKAMQDEAELLAVAIDSLADSINALNSVKVSLPSMEDMQARMEVIQQITQEVESIGTQGNVGAATAGMTLDNVVSEAVGAEGLGGSRSVNINNNLQAVIEVDGTQLGIATLQNVDNASQFVIY